MIKSSFSYSISGWKSFLFSSLIEFLTCERFPIGRLFVDFSDVNAASRSKRVRSSFSNRACWKRKTKRNLFEHFSTNWSNSKSALKFNENREEIRRILCSSHFTLTRNEIDIERIVSIRNYRNIRRIRWTNFVRISLLLLIDRLCLELCVEILRVDAFQRSFYSKKTTSKWESTRSFFCSSFDLLSSFDEFVILFSNFQDLVLNLEHQFECFPMKLKERKKNPFASISFECRRFSRSSMTNVSGVTKKEQMVKTSFSSTVDVDERVGSGTQRFFQVLKISRFANSWLRS